MAYTDADLAAVRAAITSGVRKIVLADGRLTEYQNLDHLLAAEKVIKTELDLAARSVLGVPRRRFATFGSGL